MLLKKKPTQITTTTSTSSAQKKSIYAQVMTQTDDKVQLQTLSQFLKTYNYYVSKLLLARVDPFIEK